MARRLVEYTVNVTIEDELSGKETHEREIHTGLLLHFGLRSDPAFDGERYFGVLTNTYAFVEDLGTRELLVVAPQELKFID